ncbi:hypothetical protein EYV94_24970 [Puteibacter caeruleilacunae]|nr:hypothetical protein EYV94_24970 [Puteibacter caeruleilacunae]
MRFLYCVCCIFFTVSVGEVVAQSVGEAMPSGEVLVPEISTEYVHVYRPKGDVFSGPDAENLKEGKYYPEWHSNDHCFIKDPKDFWHCFGIARPAAQPGERVKHGGEYVSFHAVSPGEYFEYSFREDAWKDTTKILPPSERPGEWLTNTAPVVVKQGDIYKMIYGPAPFRMAISRDLYNWEALGKISLNEDNGRDPNIMLWKDEYYLSYCAGNIIKMSKSKDLKHWTEPVEIFKGEVPTYECESPTVLYFNDKFYLFWCLWDRGIPSNGFGERSFVYCSDNPMDFHGCPLVTELAAHAPEIIQGEDGVRWYISSAQYPHRGLSVARLKWTRK